MAVIEGHPEAVYKPTPFECAFVEIAMEMGLGVELKQSADYIDEPGIHFLLREGTLEIGRMTRYIEAVQRRFLRYYRENREMAEGYGFLWEMFYERYADLVHVRDYGERHAADFCLPTEEMGDFNNPRTFMELFGFGFDKYPLDVNVSRRWNNGAEEYTVKLYEPSDSLFGSGKLCDAVNFGTDMEKAIISGLKTGIAMSKRVLSPHLSADFCQFVTDV
jgi:hypothetical protein